MAILSRSGGRDRWDKALLEIAKANPPRPRRATSTKMPSGHVRQTLYITPQEKLSVQELAKSMGLELSETVRMLIRTVIDVPVDSPEDR